MASPSHKWLGGKEVARIPHGGHLLTTSHLVSSTLPVTLSGEEQSQQATQEPFLLSAYSIRDSACPQALHSHLCVIAEFALPSRIMEITVCQILISP